MPIELRAAALSPAPAEIEPLTVTVRNAIRITGISQSSLYELMKAGDLAYTHAAGRRLIYFASLKKLVGLEATAA